MTAPPRKRSAPPATVALAEQARERFRTAPVHSLRRKAWGVLSVVLDGAPTVDTARWRLDAHRLPPEVRQAAVELLNVLERGAEEPAESDQAP